MPRAETGDVLEHREEALLLDVGIRVALDFDVENSAQRIRI